MLSRIGSCAAMLVAAFLLLVSCAQEPQRIATPNEVLSDELPRAALVIGNGSYESVAPLANPRNDAAAIASALNRAGYRVYEGSARIDLGRDAMQAAVKGFAEQVSRTGGIAFVYYAGHGIQVDGQNYLIPVDAKIGSMADVETQTVDLQRMLDALSDPDIDMKVIVVDACRDNPFEGIAGSGERGDVQVASASADSGLRSLSSGLSQLIAPPGSLVAFATAPGTAALDGEGANSPYAEALVNVIGEPGLRVEDVFISVRNRVSAATGGKQVPWETSSLTSVAAFTGEALSDGEQPGPFSDAPVTSAWDGRYFAERRCEGEYGSTSAPKRYYYYPKFSGGKGSSSFATVLRKEALEWRILQDGSALVQGTGGLEGQDDVEFRGLMRAGGAELPGRLGGLDCTVTLWRVDADGNPINGFTRLTGEEITDLVSGNTLETTDFFQHFSEDGSSDVVTIARRGRSPERFRRSWNVKKSQLCSRDSAIFETICYDVLANIPDASSPSTAPRIALLSPGRSVAFLATLREGQPFK